MLAQFDAAVCVVTGAASGIGEAIARALDAAGATLVLVDQHPSIQEARASYRRASAHVLDVADRAAWASLVAEIEATHGAAHLLVNNAGISVAGSFEDVPAERFDRLVSVNFGGVVNGCRALLPLLRRQEAAHIVNVCSSFAWLGFPGKSAYAASKAAVRAFSEALRAELATSPVGVTLLFPGAVDTRLVRQGYAVDAAQREREAAFLASRALAPARVAKRCLEGIQKNKARVLVGFDYRALDLLVRCSPVGAGALVAALSRRMPF